MRPLRIGCVPYLNAKPLIEGLVGLLLEPPADLVARLQSGWLDAALLPSIEVLRLGFAHVPGRAIASPGPTDSVRLWLKKPLDEVRVVALDRNSRTTNALTRILLEKKHGLSPRYVVADPAKGLKGDAAVTIGDASFKDYGVPSIDLGAEWRAFTGKPFVFALWAHRKGHPRTAEIRRVLRQPLGAVERIVEREHARVGISRERCRTYLTKCITYELGPAEKAGLKLFEKHAKSLELEEARA
jgi:predicted solute-binding protein